jgi:hypothetical protein
MNERILSEAEAKFWVKTACRDMGVPEAKPVFLNPCDEALGAYFDGEVWFYGNPSLSTVLHEVAHHVHAQRLGYDPKRAHAVGFHRICFEIRDVLRASYNHEIPTFNSYTKTRGYEVALEEWFKANVVDKREAA